MKAAIVALAVIAGSTSGLLQTDGQVFRSGVQTVFVDASVLKGHTALSDLNPANFTVTDNRAPQQIDSVTGTAIPLDVTLVVDATHAGVLTGPGANAANTGDVQRSVREIAATLQADDRLGVITFGADVVETRPMSPVGAIPEQISFANPTSNALTDRYRLTEALLAALTRPVAPDRRHLILLFALSSGKPAVPLLEHLVPAARRADALLYAVLTPIHHSPVTNLPYVFYPSEVVIRTAVTQAAEATGGKAYFTGNIVGAFHELLQEFRRSYVLRYTLQGVPPSGWHDIVVTVPSCPTCTIRARQGYMGQ